MRNTWGNGQGSGLNLSPAGREERGKHWEGSPAPCKTERCHLTRQAKLFLLPTPYSSPLLPPPFLRSSLPLFLPSFCSLLSLSLLCMYACILSADTALAPAPCQTQCCKLRMQRQKVKSYSLGLVEGGTGRWQAGVKSDIWQRELTGKFPSTFRGSESPSKMWKTVVLEREDSENL